MSNVNVEDVTNALADTSVSSSGVSFQGRSLKLDTEEDAKEIIDAINRCAKLEYLNLEGNTLGVEAAKAIAKALETRSELKRALWKDMFTGRMKSEIPIALEHLGKALVQAGARLTELDLSDNAFGPIGVEGLAALLRSSSCYNLQELRLNNNGLGITGGKLLAKALLDCYNNSKLAGAPLALRVFIAGRNRLENDGAKALAEVFKQIGSLQEIAMPQNGIYHVGITALSDSFIHNKNLQILNLNDNTIGPKGSEAIAQALPNLQKLRQINFGDCLLKTKGALVLANALKKEHLLLEDVTLGFNEIGPKGGLALAKAMHNKKNLKTLTLGGNQFGEEGRKDLENLLKSSDQFSKLGTLSEDESGESDKEEEKSEDEGGEHDEIDEESENVNDSNKTETKLIEDKTTLTKTDIKSSSNNALQDFLNKPNEETFLALGDQRNTILLDEAKKHAKASADEFLTTFIPVLMKVAALKISKTETVAKLASDLSNSLFEELFAWVQTDNISLLNNSLLVHLGLIKSEDKKFKPSWDLNGCLLAVEAAIQKKYFLPSTKDILKMFSDRLDKMETVDKQNIMKLKGTLLRS